MDSVARELTSYVHEDRLYMWYNDEVSLPNYNYTQSSDMLDRNHIIVR